MTRAAMAFLLDVDAKWVLNALAALRRTERYSLPLARRLAVARAIQEATGSSLARSFAEAGRALKPGGDRSIPILLAQADRDVAIVVDVHRILSSFNVRRALLNTTIEPRERGRPPSARSDPMQAAAAWGLDVTLLADNLAKTVEQRVRQLDAMAAFASRVQRASH